MTIKEIYNKKKHFVSRMVGDEQIVVPVSSNVADMTELFTLNEVGSFIWNCLDGQRNEEDIVNEIEKEFAIDRGTAQKDLAEFRMALENVMSRY